MKNLFLLLLTISMVAVMSANASATTTDDENDSVQQQEELFNALDDESAERSVATFKPHPPKGPKPPRLPHPPRPPRPPHNPNPPHYPPHNPNPPHYPPYNPHPVPPVYVTEYCTYNLMERNYYDKWIVERVTRSVTVPRYDYNGYEKACRIAENDCRRIARHEFDQWCERERRY